MTMRNFRLRINVNTRIRNAAAALLLLAVPALAQQKSWPDYGGGPDNSHYVESKQIDRTNVAKLDVAWSYPFGQTGFNPVIVDNVMYVTGRGALIALNATTGKEIWIHEGLQGLTSRGINYWESKDRKDRRLIFAINSYLQEINASTGKTIQTFGTNGAVNLREGLGRDPKSLGRIQSNSPGKIFEDLVILGSAPGEGYVSPPGDLRAFNVVTGKLVWTFHTVPHPGEFGYETNPPNSWKYMGGNNTWGDMSVDQKRGIVYFPTGSPTYDFYGADRIGNNLFGDSILALDARTGKRIWHFQMIHHDLWDYDETAAPQLATVTHDGKKVDIVAQAGKDGFLYVFNRADGKPIWPIPETPVPQTDVPGEKSSPTQPIPSAPPAFVRMKFTPDDINPYLSKEEQAYIKDQILSARNEGMFTPPALRGTVQMPQNFGGANWGTTAADPAKGMVFVVGMNGPALLKLEKTTLGGRGANARFGMADNGGGGGGAAAAAGAGPGLYAENCAACHGAQLEGASGPALTGITAKLGRDAIEGVISTGKGFMPAFAGKLAAPQIDALMQFLANPQGGRGGGGGRGGAAPAEVLTWNGGSVVESGPASPTLAQPPAVPGGNRASYGGTGGILPYPADVPDVPADRYNSGYGVSANAIRPPWSTLTAYDLNTGTIKWQVPIGDDPVLAAQGIHGTGARGLRNGLVTTSTGLIFTVGGDSKVRAYDEETGKVLWEHDIAGSSLGSPSMYEVNGREYLVITVSGPGTSGRGGRGGESADAAHAKLPSGYVAFALPAAAK
jgi:quinoprotein glucose dehydrogenase